MHGGSKWTAAMLAGLLTVWPGPPSKGGEEPPAAPTAQAHPAQAPSHESAEYSYETIPSIAVASEGRLSVVKNGVKMDVYFGEGPHANVAIYAVNTGRKQLVLTPERHKAILEDLLRRKFTVVVADFKAKKLAGVELEKYVVQLTADAREAADGVRVRRGSPRPPAKSRTDTYTDDYFTLMPGFTVERDVAWFRYDDVPEAFRREIARRHDKPFDVADGRTVNTYDVVHPVYGPPVGVLTNYGSNEKGREEYYPVENRFLVQAFALKNLAVVHQQYFNDPVGGYRKAYEYYGDQFAASFIRSLKGDAARLHIDPKRICCFGHSKGSETPGMLVNRRRAEPRFLYGKVDYLKSGLGLADKTLRTSHGDQTTEIACAILGAGVANNEMRSSRMLPWDDEPSRNISPFFLFADQGALMRTRSRELVAQARAHGVDVESAELDAHTWPYGEAYDRASAFADRILGVDY